MHLNILFTLWMFGTWEQKAFHFTYIQTGASSLYNFDITNSNDFKSDSLSWGVLTYLPTVCDRCVVWTRANDVKLKCERSKMFYKHGRNFFVKKTQRHSFLFSASLEPILQNSLCLGPILKWKFQCKFTLIWSALIGYSKLISQSECSKPAKYNFASEFSFKIGYK